jgi:hypothetical protein
LKRTSEETSGQIASRELRSNETRNSRLINRSDYRSLSRRERPKQTVIHARLFRSHAAIHRAINRAMLTSHSFLTGCGRSIVHTRMMMTAMRQTAHPVAIRHARIHSARQQSQRRGQQRDNHENSLHPAHRQKYYHSPSLLASASQIAPQNFHTPDLRPQ